MLALRILCLYTVVVLFSANPINAQLSSKDSSLLKLSIKNVLEFYDQNIGEQSGKFNGSQNIGYSTAVIEKNPYFETSNFTKGSIVYDGVYYNNVFLLYDEAADLVILQDSSHRIELISEKLESFNIADHTFQYISKDNANASALLRTGFYQVLVDNTTSLFTKETKKITEKIQGNELNYTIESSNYYYVKKAGRYFEIENKKGFLRLLKDKEKELKHYIKVQHLNYRKDKINTLRNLVAYYNLITN